MQRFHGLRKKKRLRKNHIEEVCRVGEKNVTSTTGLQPGDSVINIQGICGDQALKVIGVDERKRIVNVENESVWGNILGTDER